MLAINEANVPEVGSISMERLEFLVADSACSLVVDVDGTVAGFCIVLGADSTYDSVNYRWFMDRYTDAMYLDRVAFTDESRGQGLGTALYDEVHEFVRSVPGMNRWTLEVNADPPNVPSLAFHRARGFVEVGQQHTPYGITVSLMERVVEPTTGELRDQSAHMDAQHCSRDRRQRRSWRKRKWSRVEATWSVSMSANRIVSPPAPVARISPSGSMIALSPE